MNWYLYCIKNAFNFSGRARRKEYWIFLLYNVVIIFSIILIGTSLGSVRYRDTTFSIAALYVLFILIPHLAAVVRRLHDTGRSGTWWFIRFVPIVGSIWLFILLIENSQHGINKWGKNPKELGNDSEINQIGRE